MKPAIVVCVLHTTVQYTQLCYTHNCANHSNCHEPFCPACWRVDSLASPLPGWHSPEGSEGGPASEGWALEGSWEEVAVQAQHRHTLISHRAQGMLTPSWCLSLSLQKSRGGYSPWDRKHSPVQVGAPSCAGVWELALQTVSSFLERLGKGRKQEGPGVSSWGSPRRGLHDTSGLNLGSETPLPGPWCGSAIPPSCWSSRPRGTCCFYLLISL